LREREWFSKPLADHAITVIHHERLAEFGTLTLEKWNQRKAGGAFGGMPFSVVF
jgi:hypothetical protein